jgi:DNA polymerase elongation subunit (family B)
VLINSFYGYLGYSRGFFNDFMAAERVTLAGHEIIQQVERELEQRGASPIEIDTDGVYFQLRGQHSTHEQELELIDAVSEALGAGIRLTHDGRWQAMLSLRLKNYALLGYDHRLTLKGSALRNRREEPFVRRLIHELCLSFLDPAGQPRPRDRYLAYVEAVLDRRLEPDDFARTETITDASRSTELGRRLAAAVGPARIGERVAVYQRNNGELAPLADFADDEDRAYLLRRLRDAAERFRVLYDDDNDFDYDFPLARLTTDLEELRASAPVRQPRLF